MKPYIIGMDIGGTKVRIAMGCRGESPPALPGSPAADGASRGSARKTAWGVYPGILPPQRGGTSAPDDGDRIPSNAGQGAPPGGAGAQHSGPRRAFGRRAGTRAGRARLPREGRQPAVCL